MNIEIFPAENSCEQGCTTCPMARKDKEVKATIIDSEVQTTFSLVEQLCKTHSKRYDLHLASSSNLFPQLKFPELIHMARFETNKSVGLNGNVRHFSEGIRSVLNTYQMHPKVIGFSVVPQFPIVSEEDENIIQRLIDEISSWHFAKKHKVMEVSVRSNLVSIARFKEVCNDLLKFDDIHLRMILNRYCGTDNVQNKLFYLEEGYKYQSEYIGQKDKRKIIIKNRVLGQGKPDDLHARNMDQVKQLFPSWYEILDFAIAPRGVMLMHSSLSINNPIFWLSHNDFRIMVEQESSKTGFNLLEFAQLLLIQNRFMYEGFLKGKKDEVEISNDQFLGLFERYRYQVGTLQYESRRK